jgi:hypothetical protein
MIAGTDWLQGGWLAVVDDGDGQTAIRHVPASSGFLQWPDPVVFCEGGALSNSSWD